MQVSTTRRTWQTALPGLAVALLCAPVFAAPALEQVVSKLYARYAWVATFSIKPPPNAVPLAQASRKELEAIFVPELARAIWEDAQCAKKRQEICALDFDLLFDSQDPSANDLTVQADGLGTTALVCFKEAAGARRCLTFVGANVGGRVKVADIVYADDRSLRTVVGITSKSAPWPGNAAARR